MTYETEVRLPLLNCLNILEYFNSQTLKGDFDNNFESKQPSTQKIYPEIFKT